ncbi:MAG TPA: sigma-70 family RNA polymerase sigma factor [Phycisphaerae bacterium]|nr:sigma-70 family RNA polymerase sigma factor [Phycisphaerae bacterium]
MDRTIPSANPDGSAGERSPLGTPRGLTDEQRRTYARIPAEVDYVPHESFEAADAEAAYFGDRSEAIRIPVWTSFPEGADEVRQVGGRRARLNAQEESTLFLRYNYARCRLGKLVEEQLRRVSSPRGREMIVWFERAMKARADLVRANLALVLAMAKRTKIPNVDFGEVVSEGNMALLRAVEKFDVSRGFKFSTYACRAILKSYNRLATKTGRYRQRFPTEYDPEMERSDWDVNRGEIERRDSIEAVRDLLSENRARLTDVERTIVMERFAITSRDRRKTLAEVGKMVGLTNERVRQIQNHALVKIRAALVDEFVAA